MKTSSWLLAVVGVASALPAFASDRFNDKNGAPLSAESQAVGSGPLKQIYRVSGVRDDGHDLNQGVATTFLCTSWSSAPERIAFAIYNYNGALVRVATYNLGARKTFTASTHATAQFSEDALLSAGVYIDQGSAVISATSSAVSCSVTIANAENGAPVGIPLHLVRLNAQAGTVE
jgi:hypothetical protein